MLQRKLGQQAVGEGFAGRALARLGGHLSASVRNWAELRRSYLLLRPRPFGFSPGVRPRPIFLANRERAAE
jgi:hypothetical protein